MERTILVAGKDLPEGLDLADGILLSGRNVVAATSGARNVKRTEEGSTVSVEWNRTSPVSAKSLVLECENHFRRIDEALFVFDEAWFAEKFNEISFENTSRGIDEMILGFQYLAQEVLSKFEKRFVLNYSTEENLKPAKIIFYLKSSPSEVDVIKNNSLRNTVPCAANPLVAAASGAFIAFAENIAAMFANRDYVNVVLVKGDVSVELCKNERSFASWICNYLNEVDMLKNKLTAKQSVAWVKVGAKGPNSGFGFLK